MTVIATTYLVVNDIPLETYAWHTIEGGYDELLSTPALRGEDLVMHGAKGRRAYHRIVDTTVVSIPIAIVGSRDEDGDPITVPAEGLLTHRDYLRHGLGIADEATDADRGTVAATFHRGGVLPEWVGPVTVLGLYGWTTLNYESGDAIARLDLSIPAGEFEEAGS